MSADGATVAAARALGGGRGALSDSSVVPLARGVARAAHLAALSGAVRGRGERKTHFSSTVRGSHVSLSADRCASRMGRALSSAPGARTATLSAQRDVGRGSSVRQHSLDEDRVCHYFQSTRLALGTILY